MTRTNEHQPLQPSLSLSSDLIEPRLLTKREESLVKWLLKHGTPEARQFLPSISSLQVTGRCLCGCASINFGETSKGEEFRLLSDYAWKTARGNRCGCFLFAVGDRLAGLEVWSIDGGETPTSLPPPEKLIPLKDID